MQLPVRYQVMESVGPDDNSEANIVHAAATVDLLRVTWADGRVTELRGLDPNQTLVLQPGPLP